MNTFGELHGALFPDPPNNRAPNSHDFEVLESLYSHLDEAGDDGGNNGCKGPAWKCPGSGAAAPPAFDMELPGMGQWGRLISVSRVCGQSVFVQDFGRGFHVYTHVTWILEMAEEMVGRGH